MHIVSNIKNFLYDQKYFINVYNDFIHVFNYTNLLRLSETEIVLEMELFKLEIKGASMHVVKMAERELLIKGELFFMEFKK